MGYGEKGVSILASNKDDEEKHPESGNKQEPDNVELEVTEEVQPNLKPHQFIESSKFIVDTKLFAQGAAEVSEAVTSTVKAAIIAQYSKDFASHETKINALIQQIKQHEERVHGLLRQAEKREKQVRDSLAQAKQSEKKVNALLDKATLVENNLADHIRDSKDDFRNSTQYLVSLSSAILAGLVVTLMALLIAYNQHEIEDKIGKGLSDLELKILKGEYNQPRVSENNSSTLPVHSSTKPHQAAKELLPTPSPTTHH